MSDKFERVKLTLMDEYNFTVTERDIIDSDREIDPELQRRIVAHIDRMMDDLLTMGLGIEQGTTYLVQGPDSKSYSIFVKSYSGIVTGGS